MPLLEKDFPPNLIDMYRRMLLKFQKKIMWRKIATKSNWNDSKVRITKTYTFITEF